MKKMIPLFATILILTSIALANTEPGKVLEAVHDPISGEFKHYQCINPGSDCDTAPGEN